MLIVLLKTVALSLSGILAPGALNAATIQSGLRNRHAGLLISVGHVLIEGPLILLLILGVGWFIREPRVAVLIGVSGGLVLLWMGIGQARAVFQPLDEIKVDETQRPIRTGIVLSAGNPYFLIWWAAVGLGLIHDSLEWGVLCLFLFVLLHWLGDFLWMEFLSFSSHEGHKRMGARWQKSIMAVCAAVMIYFGCQFVFDAAQTGIFLAGRYAMEDAIRNMPGDS